jgi:hypothetical protein
MIEIVSWLVGHHVLPPVALPATIMVVVVGIIGLMVSLK